jgi:hypothetical protein
MNRYRFAALSVLLGLSLSLASCEALPAVAPTPTAPSAFPFSLPELKSLLLDEFGELFFCDPDYYPVAREDEAMLASERFPEIAADVQEFRVLLYRLGLEVKPVFSSDEQLAIYREHKTLAAISTEPTAGGHLFQMRVTGGGTIEALEGEIDSYGRIRLDTRQPSSDMCPICLAKGTRIATPEGEVAVEDLHRGVVVWSLDRSGRRMAVEVEQVGRTPVPEGHQMIRLTLADGRTLTASPGHPLPDGAPISTLRPGAYLAGSMIIAADRVGYSGRFTFDLLAAGETGTYWADGILLGSSLSLAP